MRVNLFLTENHLKLYVLYLQSKNFHILVFVYAACIIPIYNINGEY